MAGTQSEPSWSEQRPTRADLHQDAPENTAEYWENRPAPSENAGVIKQRLTSTAPGRTIFGLMFFAVGFSLVGHEIKALSTPAASAAGALSSAQKGNVPTGAKIILGGFAATAILTVISHAGDAGEQLGVGLAMITAVTSMLVYGAPVWEALAGAVGGSGKAAAGASPTTPTKATTATTGASSTAALAQAA